MASIWSDLPNIPDPRTGNAQRHALLDILTIALVAAICGSESCVDFADFARDREALFREFLELAGGPPSHDTFSRVFRLLDPAAFATCFESFLEEDLGADGSGVLAIDGKTLRRSHDRAACARRPTPITAGSRPAVARYATTSTGSCPTAVTPARRRCGGLPCWAWSRRPSRRTARRRRSDASSCRRWRWDPRPSPPPCGRWRIENCLHDVLDVSFDEDRARNRKEHGVKTLRFSGNSH